MSATIHSLMAVFRLIDDNSLILVGSATGSGHVKVDENVFDSNGIFQGTIPTNIDPLFGDNITSGHLIFPPNARYLQRDKHPG